MLGITSGAYLEKGMIDFMLIENLLECGVIIINKPPKLSSHEVTALVKKITGSGRAGHAGTLDPNVTGVLPIALGRATKLLDYIVAKDKTYICLMKVKIQQSESVVLDLFKKFTGEIVQTPPKMSAVRKVPRKRNIEYLKLIEIENNLILFEAKVQAGTYIRTLCVDMGKLCGGARMVELRRIAVGEIKEDSCFTMQDLSDAMWLYKEKSNTSSLSKMIRPVEEYLKNYPKIQIRASSIPLLLNGAQLVAPWVISADGFKKDDKVAMYFEDGKFIGMGCALISSLELENIKNGVVLKTERIHIRKQG